MLVMLLIVLFSTFSFTFFSYSLKLSCLNRIVVNTPKQIFETSIPLYQETDDPIIYFDKERLETTITDYYERNIKRYVQTYLLSFYYYNREDQSYCFGQYCDCVEITLNAVIDFNISYDRILKYQIQQGYIHG